MRAVCEKVLNEHALLKTGHNNISPQQREITSAVCYLVQIAANLSRVCIMAYRQVLFRLSAITVFPALAVARLAYRIMLPITVCILLRHTRFF